MANNKAMDNNHTIYHTGFGTQPFEIECNCDKALNMAKFLFDDLILEDPSEPPICYDIICVGKQPMWSLWNDEKKLYYGTSLYKLAYILMNEVIFYAIDKNHHQHALHAGAVYNGETCILLPGSSGSGKSTFTLWLAANGFKYLTDELVFLSPNGMVTPLTRPINLKTSASEVENFLSSSDKTNSISDKNGTIIPHRNINPDYSPATPKISHIIYPKYEEGAELSFEEISPAKSSCFLLKSHVNARNLDRHGVPSIAKIVRSCKSYSLKYSDFSDLEAVFSADNKLFI